MRLVISFFLALISYFLILFILYFLFPKPVKQKQVLIHTAIVTKNFSLKNSITKKTKTIKPHVKETLKQTSVKKVVHKTKAKSALTQGGNVAFNDIFKNVKANVPTAPVHLKKQLVMSRFKGNNILKNLSKVKAINVNISYETQNNNSNVKQNKINELINKIGQVWYQISNIPGEYAIIKIIVQNFQINAIILDSNLNKNEQEMLVNQIKQIKFDKNINLTVKFQTKVNK